MLRFAVKFFCDFPQWRMTGELGIDDSINLGYHEANPNWLVVWNMFFFHNIWDNPSH